MTISSIYNTEIYNPVLLGKSSNIKDPHESKKLSDSELMQRSETDKFQFEKGIWEWKLHLPFLKRFIFSISLQTIYIAIAIVILQFDKDKETKYYYFELFWILLF